MKFRSNIIDRFYQIFVMLSIIWIDATILPAGDWTDQVTQFPGLYPNRIICRDINGNQILMIGEFGDVWISNNGGNIWKNASSGVLTVPLYAAEIEYGIDTVLIVGGQGGTIYRSTDLGQNWVPIFNSASDIRSIVSYGGRIWAGGDAGELYFSSDRGQTWIKATLSRGSVDIVEIVPTNYGIHLAANRGTTAFVLADDNSDTTFDPVDSLSNVQLTSVTQKFGKLYFAGTDLLSSGPVIFIKEDLGVAWGTASPYIPPINPSGIIDIEGLTDKIDKLWIATFDGKIYEGDPFAGSFIPVYENFTGDYIRSIATPPETSSLPMAWAAGTNGLMLIYDFMVVDLFPYPNDFLDPGMNRFDIRFSGIPDLPSIDNGIFIYSSIKGLVPFSAAYALADSSLIELHLTNTGSVPGEIYTIILTNVIRELNSPNRFTRIFSYCTSVGPMYSGDFSLTAPSSLMGAGNKTSNFVTGFFNADEYFDLATFTDTDIVFYAGQAGGGFAPSASQPIAGGVQVDASLSQQLKKTDINLDGKPDLILYDRNNYQVYTNTSNAGFSFSANSNQFISNLFDIEVTSVDHDSTLDMIMLTDSLQMRTNVDAATLGNSDYAEANTDWVQFEAGDIDDDGFNDLMLLTSAGELVLRHGNPDGGFDMTYTIPGKYDLIKLGEMNNNGTLELIAAEDSIIHVFEFLASWNFTPISTIFQVTESRIESFSLADFNGDRRQDVVLTTSTGEMKIFINMGGGFFEERPEHEKILDIKATGLTRGDFDQDGLLDFVLFDTGSGDFQIVNSKPADNSLFNFDSVHVGLDHVYLQWPPFEPLGELQYYNIFRGPDSTNLSVLNTSSTNVYTDSAVASGEKYWYRIEAMDIFGTPHFIAEIPVAVPRSLTGSISGVLSDTTAPYLVGGALRVPQDSLLQILPGVELLFQENASFSVYGRLLVQGSAEQNVSFRSATTDTSQRWDGIIISALVDTTTVQMSWVNVEGAAIAFSIQNRPTDIQYAEISGNRTAIEIDFPNGSLQAEHLLVHRNNIGIHSLNGSKLNLKNVTLIDNKKEAVLTENTSNINISIINSIIWNNNLNSSNQKSGPDIRRLSSGIMDIQYSTIDSIAGNFTAKNFSSIPPLFETQTADLKQYKPDPLSPTIDFGDPADDFQLEPQPNGGRINQGVYGGTTYATPSLQPQIGVKSDTLQLASEPGKTDTKILVIRNKGFRELRLDNLILHKTEFNYAAAFPQFIQPGDSLVLNILFSPPARGAYRDTILLQSNDPHYPFPGKPLVLAGTGLNRRPNITTSGLINGVQDFAYRDSVQAVDADGDNLVFQPLNIPTWMTVSSDGQLTGIPTNASVGTNIPVVIRVIDGFGGFDTLQTTINVQNVNDPPRITTTSLLDAIEDRPYIDTVFAVDIDGDSLIFSGLNIPAWLKVSPDGALSGIPTNDDVASDTPVEIMVTDNNGTYDTLSTGINVINTNDPPEFKNIPDTVAYTFIPFEYNIGAIDIDGDRIGYSDDSPLFAINADSGIIRYTPALSDTGIYDISITVSDQDTSVTDTFQLEVSLTPITAIPDPVPTALDQEIRLDWIQPDNLFYTGTVIAWSDAAPVDDVRNAQGAIDTSFAAGASVSVKITDLGIAKTYYLSVLNYFQAGIRIYSDPVQVSVTTLAPSVVFDNQERIFHVPPDMTLDTLLTVRNAGGGTLIMRFAYTPDQANSRWFAMDTMVHTILPGDSAKLALSISPLKSMEDIDHTVSPVLLTNQPGWIPQRKNLILKILFDRYPPTFIPLFEPAAIHPYTALRFDFTANDTVEIYGWKFGSATDSLRARYRFSRVTTTGAQILKQETGIGLGQLDFYPLPDGLYHFELWIFDPDSNGFLKSVLSRNITISSSSIPVAANRWYLASFPRKTNLNLFEFFTDSSALIYRWNNEQNKYISFVDSTLEPGEGVWWLAYKPQKFDLEKIPVSVDSDSVVVRLVRGWNQIGVPRGFHLNLGESKLLVPSAGAPLDIQQAIVQKLIAPAVYWYRSSALLPGYEWSDLDTTIASPWRGYWVLAAEPGQLILPSRPAFPRSSGITTIPADTGSVRLTKVSTPDNWQVVLQLASDLYTDYGNIIGIGPQRNGLPVYEPPHLDRFCAAYFNTAAGKITRDIRASFDSHSEVKIWDLIIETSSSGKKHMLTWADPPGANGVYLYLVDPAAEKVIDMNEEWAYAFSMQTSARTLKVYATQDAEFEPKIIPLSFRLDQNYPNPFNPATTIRFGVPEHHSGEKIQLRIFNVLGQEIRTLIDREMEPGYHEMMWDGTNTAGNLVASGIYFYRLMGAGGQMLVRKMILIK